MHIDANDSVWDKKKIQKGFNGAETFYCMAMCLSVKGAQAWDIRRRDFFSNQTYVRHVTGNDHDYLRKIPRVVVQKSALL